MDFKKRKKERKLLLNTGQNKVLQLMYLMQYHKDLFYFTMGKQRNGLVNAVPLPLRINIPAALQCLLPDLGCHDSQQGLLS